MKIARSFQGIDRTRELVRMRDKHTCQICHIKWKKGKRRFDVHHKDKDPEKTKKYDRIKDMGGLITLCHSCHLNLHHASSKPEKIKNFSTMGDWALKNGISVRQAYRLYKRKLIPAKKMKVTVEKLMIPKDFKFKRIAVEA